MCFSVAPRDSLGEKHIFYPQPQCTLSDQITKKNSIHAPNNLTFITHRAVALGCRARTPVGVSQSESRGATEKHIFHPQPPYKATSQEAGKTSVFISVSFPQILALARDFFSTLQGTTRAIGASNPGKSTPPALINVRCSIRIDAVDLIHLAAACVCWPSIPFTGNLR